MGIKWEPTVPYAPEQNGVSKCVNRTIMEQVRAILSNTKLPKELWSELASTVVYLKTRSPTRALTGRTPFEAWYGRKPNVSHCRILESIAYVHVPKE